MKLPLELIKKARSAKSAEELLLLAKENGIEMTADEAQTYFEQINANKLDDDLLEGVSGGWVIVEDTEEPTYERIGKSSRSQCR